MCPIEFLKGNTAAKAKAKKTKASVDLEGKTGTSNWKDTDESTAPAGVDKDEPEAKEAGSSEEGGGGYLSENPFDQLRAASRGQERPTASRGSRSENSKREIGEGVLKLTSEYIGSSSTQS